MSMMGGRLPAGFDQVGETVASFPSYEAAQKAVSALIAGEVPAKQVAIVGTGLRSIERVTGKLGYATAARSGALNGLLLGLLFSAIFVIGTPSPPIQLFVGVLIVGIALGMLLSLLTFAIVRRRRDFASVMQVVADHYDITVSAESVHRAREILGASTAAQVVETASAENWDEPPRYGERIATPGAPTPPPPVTPPVAEGDVVTTPEGIEVAPEPAPAPDAEPGAQGDAVPTDGGIVVAPEGPEGQRA